MPWKRPKGWPGPRPYRCLAQFVVKSDWEIHRANAHDTTVACGVGNCPQLFAPNKAEELALHRHRHVVVSEAEGEPPKKRKRSEPAEPEAIPEARVRSLVGSEDPMLASWSNQFTEAEEAALLEGPDVPLEELAELDVTELLNYL
ncbi:unnamed protein product [Owenia fusiformis]|uniref:Uncharacterized protein n=1 Tax=Owenia fusiformis TaxID=6347 RepID=A0A8J1UHY6_OWEFU|nr:unnamed protein product [Owenia fusiformis]